MAIRLGRETNTPSAPASPAGIPDFSDSKFIRYIGYDNKTELEKKLSDLYQNAQKSGVCFDNNPDSSNIREFLSSKGADIPSSNTDISAQLISGLLSLCKISPENTAENTSNLIYTAITNASPNYNNALSQIIYWTIVYTEKNVDNILYIDKDNDIKKNTVLWLYLMSLLGCRVTYVNYSDESTYLKADREGRFSKLVKGSHSEKITLVNFSGNHSETSRKLNEITSTVSSFNLKFLNTDGNDIFRDILTTADQRKLKIISSDSFIPVYFAAYIGLDDKAVYNNSLYSVKEELQSRGKQHLLISELKGPKPDEVGDLRIANTKDSAMISSFADKIQFRDSGDRTALAKKAFVEIISKSDITKAYYTSINFIFWLRQITAYFDFCKNDIPVVIYYGEINSQGLQFLHLLSKCGLDVFYFNPDKSILPVLKSSGLENLTLIECRDSQSNMPFPDKIIKTTLSTSAYDAERSLDSILYNDNTMFRAYQYSYSRNQTLKTTYEELGIMWHQQSMYRTGFDSKNNYVIVPNLFAKINGIPNGDLQAYYKDIAFKLAPMSVYYNKIPFFKPVSTITRTAANAVSSGTKIDIEALKKSSLNKYDYMSDNIQYLLFNKMQEVIDSGFIDVPERDIVPLVLTVGMNIPNNLLQITQGFDFTKDIPKIVIAASGKQTFEAFECILLVLFNMIGFDIIIFTPTGYKNLETFIRPEAFQVFNHGEFKYDFIPQHLKIPKEIPQEKTSFFGRIFKGKK